MRGKDGGGKRAIQGDGGDCDDPDHSEIQIAVTPVGKGEVQRLDGIVGRRRYMFTATAAM